MKERPILFSTPMVQAILQGKKTQTRRIVKSRHESGLFQVSRRITDGQIVSIQSLDWDERNCEKDIVCPYGQVGDILWCRETWCEYNDGYAYKATTSGALYEPNGYAYMPKWKPSIHMPRAACRLRLQITDVRVERLQDISERDAKAEGVEYKMFEGSGLGYKIYGSDTYDQMTQLPRVSFASLWQSINGSDSWEKNEFVWCLTFQPITN